MELEREKGNDLCFPSREMRSFESEGRGHRATIDFAGARMGLRLLRRTVVLKAKRRVLEIRSYEAH